MLLTVLSILWPYLAMGAVVGAVAQYTNFCSVGAIADVMLAKDWRRARSWIMAAAVALVGTQAFAAAGLANPQHSIYVYGGANALFAAVGGVLFGYGMAIAGGCLQRALVRIGGGSIKSLVTVLVMAATGVPVSYAMNASALWRATAWSRTVPSTLHEIIADIFGLPWAQTTLAVISVVALALLVVCLVDRWFRQSRAHLWGGVVIGAVVAMAWLNPSPMPRGMNLLVDLIYSGLSIIPPYVGYDLGGFTVSPVVYAALVALVLIGIVLGSFVVALMRRDLMLDRFMDRQDVQRHVIGGILMGLGGAMAYGCTFGQGLSGFSTLSITSFIAIAAMIAGCVWGIRALETGSAWRGLRLCFGRT